MQVLDVLAGDENEGHRLDQLAAVRHVLHFSKVEALVLDERRTVDLCVEFEDFGQLDHPSCWLIRRHGVPHAEANTMQVTLMLWLSEKAEAWLVGVDLRLVKVDDPHSVEQKVTQCTGQLI